MQMDDLILSFVEDSREHLADIETLLLDIEAAGEGADEDLVNSVFRAAHSIKGGAGMLGLDTIKDLAHRLENVLHMLRGRELAPSSDVVGVLLQGFDRLSALIDNVQESESMSIREDVDKLVALAESGMPEEERGQAEQTTEVSVGGVSVFNVDALSLKQAESGGNYVYVLEFDLIHDIHRRDKTPLDVIKMLTDSGRIVDCRVDIEAVGTLEDEFTGAIPFFVLFSSILEPKYARALVGLPEERITPIDVDEAARALVGEEAIHEFFGACSLTIAAGQGRLKLPRRSGVEGLRSLQAALLACRERCTSLTLDFSAVEDCDVFLLQLLLSAERMMGPDVAFARHDGIPEEMARQADALGMRRGVLAEQGLNAAWLA